MPPSLGNPLPLAAHTAMPDQNVQEELKGYGRTKSSMLELTRAESISRSSTYSLPIQQGQEGGVFPMEAPQSPSQLMAAGAQHHLISSPSSSGCHHISGQPGAISTDQPHRAWSYLLQLLNPTSRLWLICWTVVTDPSHCVQFTTNPCTVLAGHSESLGEGPSVTLQTLHLVILPLKADLEGPPHSHLKLPRHPPAMCPE